MVLHLAPGLSWRCSPPSRGSGPKGRFTKGTGRTSLEARTLPSLLLSQVEAKKDPVDLANVFRVETFPVHDPPAALAPPSSVYKKVHAHLTFELYDSCEDGEFRAVLRRKRRTRERSGRLGR